MKWILIYIVVVTGSGTGVSVGSTEFLTENACSNAHKAFMESPFVRFGSYTAWKWAECVPDR